jgi:hypothetical protein
VTKTGLFKVPFTILFVGERIDSVIRSVTTCYLNQCKGGLRLGSILEDTLEEVRDQGFPKEIKKQCHWLKEQELLVSENYNNRKHLAYHGLS